MARYSVVFVGTLQDGGFNQAALEGVTRVAAAGVGDIVVVDGIPYDTEAMCDALAVAASRSDGVVFVGGQGNVVVPEAAAAFPDRAFAVVQGNVTGPNLASYDVLQEQSAFLAGALAAKLTQTGVVGHLSGHRVPPGLKGRAAFATGVAFANPDVRLVTGFCGTQDDSAVTERWTQAIADEGADIVFTMLNGARAGAIAACRAAGIRQIGNAKDWCAVDGQVFVASAVARIDMGVEAALRDMMEGRRPPKVREIGLADGAAHLAMAEDVPAVVREEITTLASQIAAGRLTVLSRYDGPEFEARA